MLKLTIKIYLYSLLHVSVLPDYPQGAYAEPCQRYLLTYLLTPWSRVLLVLQLVKKFPAFY
jgi:hypothetical protein